jgi:hypothetical protein
MLRLLTVEWVIVVVWRARWSFAYIHANVETPPSKFKPDCVKPFQKSCHCCNATYSPEIRPETKQIKTSRKMRAEINSLRASYAR